VIIRTGMWPRVGTTRFRQPARYDRTSSVRAHEAPASCSSRRSHPATSWPRPGRCRRRRRASSPRSSCQPRPGLRTILTGTGGFRNPGRPTSHMPSAIFLTGMVPQLVAALAQALGAVAAAKIFKEQRVRSPSPSFAASDQIEDFAPLSILRNPQVLAGPVSAAASICQRSVITIRTALGSVTGWPARASPSRRRGPRWPASRSWTRGSRTGGSGSPTPSPTLPPTALTPELRNIRAAHHA
jgi:hypothetical protein